MAEAKRIISIRLLVGYLGERGQENWWPSEFLSPQSEAFLVPIFQKSAGLAQLNGVIEAARRVHDERIGVGRVFHIFRLPQMIEQRCFEFVQHSNWLTEVAELVGSHETALAALRKIADPCSSTEEGPIRMGNRNDLNQSKWISTAAGLYQSAFEKGIESFPYFTDEE